MSLTIKEYIQKLSEFPSNYTAESYQGEDNGLRIENEKGEQVDFISD